MKRRFKQVDVFGVRSFAGNPVAVILDCDGLSTDAMAEIARWTNLSETTFVLPPQRGGDYQLRIFTPQEELAFGGHPTLGSAHAVLETLTGALPDRLVQECGVGAVQVTAATDHVGPGRSLAFDSPSVQASPLAKAVVDEIRAALRLRDPLLGEPMLMDVGPRWCICDLGTGSAVERLAPDMTRLAEVSRAHGLTGVTVFGRHEAAERTLRVRSFAPASGVPEDPACGSGNASVATYLACTGRLQDVGPTYRALQGHQIGRDAQIEISVDLRNNQVGVTIMGRTITLVDGYIHI